jgi:hypothetical protein
MLGITLIPLTILFAFVWGVFSLKIRDYVVATEVRQALHFSTKASSLIHALQTECDVSALHVSGLGGITKPQLVREYARTDEVIDELPYWPVDDTRESHFRSKSAFFNFLNQHRYELDSVKLAGSRQKTELEFYTRQINVFMAWFFDAITEAGSGTI